MRPTSNAFPCLRPRGTHLFHGLIFVFLVTGGPHFTTAHAQITPQQHQRNAEMRRAQAEIDTRNREKDAREAAIRATGAREALEEKERRKKDQAAREAAMHNAAVYRAERRTQAESRLNSAITFYSKRDYGMTRINCDEAINIDLTYSDAYIYRGLANHMLKNYERAIEDYTKAINLKEDFEIAVIRKPENASKSLTELRVLINQEYAVLFTNRGISYMRLGQYERAIKDFDEAIPFDKDTTLYLNRGFSYLSLGQYERAIEDYDEGIRLNTMSSDLEIAYNNKGVAYIKMERYIEAIIALKHAIRLKPDFAKAYFHLGEACLRIGNREAALEQYKKLKTLNATSDADKLYAMINQKP